MTDTYQNILSDATKFLKENYEPKNSWNVPSTYIVPLSPKEKKSTKPSEPLPVYTPLPKAKIIPQQKKTEEPFVPQTPTIPPSKSKIEEHVLPFEELKKSLHKILPQFVIRETPLSDKVSYIKALEAKTLILSFQEDQSSTIFLQNIQKAIATYHTSAHILEAKSSSFPEDLGLFFEQTKNKLTLASPTILKHKQFLPFIKEIPASSEWFLGKSRLLLLEPFETYFTNPLQKKTLWKTICAILKVQDTPA